MWPCGTPKQFIIHVQQVIDAIKQKGLMEYYTELVGPEKECTSKTEEAWLSFEISQGEIKDYITQDSEDGNSLQQGQGICCISHKQGLLDLLQPSFIGGHLALE